MYQRNQKRLAIVVWNLVETDRLRVFETDIWIPHVNDLLITYYIDMWDITRIQVYVLTMPIQYIIIYMHTVLLCFSL